MQVTFSAQTIRGAGRGTKELQCPTINLRLSDVPSALNHGIYACLVRIENEQLLRNAVAHYGPRPVFEDDTSFEVHLLDEAPDEPPRQISVTIVGERIRDVRDFPSADALKQEMKRDIAKARAMLSSL